MATKREQQKAKKRKYDKFLLLKSQIDFNEGFEPIELSEHLFEFQKSLTDWAIRKGRAAIFADCGTGKTLMELVWADNVIRHTNKSVLLLTPLAVGQQVVKEGEKFGIPCIRSRDGVIPSKPSIVVTNYERLHYFNADDFAGVVGDESSAIKNFQGKTKAAVTEFMRTIPFRLLCTATAAPNDYFELGTSSEALGRLGFRDMITQFFAQETSKEHLGWGRTKYRFRGHAERPFWRWVCSWARAMRKPSDLGFPDKGFDLPPLHERETIVKAKFLREGYLLSLPAIDMHEQREERRNTIEERCERAAEDVAGHDGASVAWCHLNSEADRLEKMIPNAKQVSGSMSDEQKEERLLAFASGDLEVLITKPKLGAWGLNWQHCSNIVMFPSYSWEQYYQAVRRCYRFGQTKPVNVNIITTEGELNVLKSLRRKADQTNKMFDSLVKEMNHELNIEKVTYGNTKAEVPTWI